MLPPSHPSASSREDYDSQLPTSDSRLPTPDSRLPTPDFLKP
ncbi:hypothetical protein [Moorena sp. SIOASIH]|nr:hypothetical protein [Moorena sp. SIOASIH]